MSAFWFIEIEDVLLFHREEMKYSGGSMNVRDLNALESAIAAPRSTFDGKYLMDLFEMAATYVNSIAKNHPFLDGNKRAAALAALAFLCMNGYDYNEDYDEELADKIIELVTNKINKTELADCFRSRCTGIA